MITDTRIKRLRHQFGLSQRDFATLVGWSPKTVEIYEIGALPSATNNSRLLELEDNPTMVIDLVERVSQPLTTKGKESLQQYLK